MGELLVVGLSHKTAPVDVRERLSVSTENVAAELEAVLSEAAIREGMLLSTCNRVELYAAAEDPMGAVDAARAYLTRRAGDDRIEDFVYARWGSEAVQHAFRVASSLDSMVVGEPQILGQVKSAYAAAHAAGGVGTLLGRCFHRAFAVAKRVRTETGIAAGAVSVSSIAIELAAKIFGSLDGRRALLVGAGKMSESAAKSLSKQGARLTVVNRSPERAEALAAACDGQARPYELLSAEMTAADVAITSTASPGFVITPDLMRDVVKARRGRPLFLIDIAVPRDVDPRVGQLNAVFLYDVDDLEKVAEENLTKRRREATAAENIVLAETQGFEKWRQSLSLTPTIVALRKRFAAVARAELERTMPRLKGLSRKEQKTLEAMTNAMVNKLLHGPLTELKENGRGPEGARLIDATRRLFDLDESPAASSEKESAESAESAEDVVGELAPAGRGGKGS